MALTIEQLKALKKKFPNTFEQKNKDVIALKETLDNSELRAKLGENSDGLLANHVYNLNGLTRSDPEDEPKFKQSILENLARQQENGDDLHSYLCSRKQGMDRSRYRVIRDHVRDTAPEGKKDAAVEELHKQLQTLSELYGLSIDLRELEESSLTDGELAEQEKKQQRHVPEAGEAGGPAAEPREEQRHVPGTGEAGGRAAKPQEAQPAEEPEEVSPLDQTVEYKRSRRPKSAAADRLIEGCMGDVKKQLEKGEYDTMTIARIMAARDLAGTTGGSVSQLKVKLQPEAVERKARELAGNAQFKNWLEGTSAEAMSKALSGRTHGGRLDKAFTEYLAERPAGQLSNDKPLARYMPTAKKRIEALIKQNEAGLRATGADHYQSEGLAAKNAAEIIAIRNRCHVQRGGYGLDKQIPVTDDEKQKLPKLTETLSDDFLGKHILADAGKTQLGGRTHGGAMLESVRKAYANPGGDWEPNQSTLEMLSEGKRGVRMKQLQKEAKQLSAKLKEAVAKEEPVDELMKQCRQNAKEFYAHSTALLDAGGKPLPLEQQRQAMQEDIPWKRVDRIMEAVESDPTFRDRTGDPGKMLEHIEKEILQTNVEKLAAPQAQVEQRQLVNSQAAI